MKKITFLLVLYLLILHGGFVNAQTDTLLRHFPTALESFEKTDDMALPIHWKIESSLANGELKWIVLGSSFDPLGNTGYAACYSTASDDWLISPQYQLPDKEEITLEFYGSSVNTTDAVIEVLISTSDRELSSFTSPFDTIHFQLIQSGSKLIYTKKSLNLKAFKGKKIYIAFKAITPAENNTGILIDDIRLFSANIHTPEPLLIDSIGFTSAMVKWDIHPSPTFELAYSTSPLPDPNTGGSRVRVEGNSYKLTSLTSSHKYYTYLRVLTSDYISGDWVGPYIFTTLCSPIEIPQDLDPKKFYVANFSDLTCWGIVNKKSATTWKMTDNSSMQYYEFGLSENYQGAEDWLVAPKMKIPTNHYLKFHFLASDYRCAEMFSVWFIQDTSKLNNEGITLLPLRTYFYNTTYNPDSITIDLSSIAGQTGHLAIRIESPAPYSKLTISSFSVEEISNCLRIENLQIRDVTEAEAGFSWSSFGNSFEFKVSDQSSFDPNSTTLPFFSSTTSDKTLTLNNLEKGKDYFLFIRTLCTEDKKSDWTKISFRTKNSISSFPYKEEFSTWSVSKQPNTTSDWSVRDGNGDMNTFQGYYKYPLTNTAAGFADRSGSYYKQNRNQWMISPQIILPEAQEMLCSFLVGTNSSGSSTALKAFIESFQVLISTTTTDSASFKKITPRIDFFTQGGFKPVYIDLSPYKGQKVYIAIQLCSKYTNNGFYLDNFKVDYSQHPTPRNFKIDSSSYNKINLSWEGESSTYQIAYQKYMFDPDENAETILLPKTNKKQITIDRLSPGSTYYIYVQAVYSDLQHSEWIGPICQTTPCAAISTPLLETFDGWVGPRSSQQVDYPIGCWRYINLGKPYKETDTTNDTLELSNRNSEDTPWETGLGVFIDCKNRENDTSDRYLISPQFKMPKQGAILSYWASPVSEEVFYTVRLSTSGTHPNDFIYTLFSDTLKAADGGGISNWQKRIIELKDKANNLFPDSLVHIAFVIKGLDATKKGSMFRLDDVNIEQNTPTCSLPDSVENFSSGKDVTLSWKSTAPAFNVLYHHLMFNPNDNPYIGTLLYATGTNAKATITITNLAASKPYYVWIQTICEGGKLGMWMGPYTIYSSCEEAISEYPYTNNFNSISLGSSPMLEQCWTTHSEHGTGFVGNNMGSLDAQNKPSMGLFSAFNTVRDATGRYAVVTEKLPSNTEMHSLLISPKFHIADTQNLVLSFNYETVEPSLTELFYVLISTSDKNEASFTDTLAEINCRQSSYLKTFTNDLSNYKGKEIYVAIAHRTKNLSLFDVNAGLLIDNFSIMENDCPYAKNISVEPVNLLDSTAQVSWEGSSEKGWLIRTSPTDFNPYASYDYNKNNYSEKVIGNLTSSNFKVPERQQLVIYIRSKDCSSTEFWVGPFYIRFCKEQENRFPYLENFNNWSHDPLFLACWTTMDADKDGISFFQQAASTKGRNNSKCIGVTKSEYPSPFKQDNWLISPQFNFSSLTHPMLEFWCISGVGKTETFKIYASKMMVPDTASDYELLDSITVKNPSWDRGSSKTNWLRVVSDLSRYAGESYLTIAIQHCSDSAISSSFFIDDLSIKDILDCEPISDVTTDTVKVLSASISWAHPSETIKSKFRFKKGLFEYDDPYSYPTNKESVFNPSLNKFQINLSGLQTGSEYFYYVSPQCSPTESENYWYGPFEFKTDCDAINSYPYTMLFSSWANKQDRNFGCWNVVDANKDGISFKGEVNLFKEAAGYMGYGKEEIKADDWLISPPIKLPGSPLLTTTLRTGSGIEDFTISIAKKQEGRNADGSFDLSKFTPLLHFNTTIVNDSILTIDSKSIPALLDYVNEEVYFSIHLNTGVNTQRGNILYVNDFTLTSEDYCYLKPTNLTTIAYEKTASIEWEGKTKLWEIQYWTEGKDTTTIKAIPGNAYTLSGLTPNHTTYLVRVRADDCPNVIAPWSEVSVFITEATCKPISTASYVLGIDSCSIKWISGSAEKDRGYEIKWKEKGAAQENLLYVEGTDTVLYGLSPETEYLYSVRKVCTVGDTSMPYDGHFTTYSVCQDPFSILLSKQEKKRLEISWSSTKASKNIVSHKLLSSTDWVYDTTQVNSIVISNLLPGKTYQFHIQSECESGNFSNGIEQVFSTLDPTYYQVQLELNDDSFGSVSGEGLYPEESSIHICAISKKGYEFEYWESTSGKILSRDSNFSFSLVCDTLVRAVFSKVCSAPSNLRILSSSPDSCLLDWEGDASSYRLFYKNSDALDWKREIVYNTKGLITNLETLRTYEWKVQALCGDKSSQEVIGETFLTTSALADLNGTNVQLLISPNPSNKNSKINIDIRGGKKANTFYLMDIYGRVILSQNLKNESNFYLDLNGLSPGIYLLKIKGTDWEKNERIVIE